MKILKPYLLLAVIVILSACIKEPDNVGLNVQPDSDRFYFFTDSNTTITVNTVYEDSVATDERSHSLLGNITDSIFGRSSANIYTQIRLGAPYPNGFGNITPVSATLHLAYSGYYGDVSQEQSIKIYELTDSISVTETYYSNNTKNWYDENELLTEYSFIPNPTDSTLAISLPIELAEKILLADSSDLVDNIAFLNFFKGLAIISDTTKGNSILYFDLISDKSLLRLSYTDTSAKTVNTDFQLNNKCARFNTFYHNYNNTPISNVLTDTISNKVYIQAMGGVKTKLKFKIPEKLFSNDIAIIKAQLILKVDENTIDDTYKTPEKLLIELIDDNEGFDAPIDYYMGGDHFNGAYNATTKSYTFNINRYIQSIIKKEKENKGFYIIPLDNRITANRAVLLNNTKYKMELIIYYSPL